jgi:hypothetical protein
MNNQSDTNEEEKLPSDPPAGQICGAADCSAIASQYGWENRNISKKLGSWEAEIEHMKRLGYELVPPNYHIPHWSTAMSMGDALPKIYVLRLNGPDELSAHFDCLASRLGYPVFFRSNGKGLPPR